MSTTITFNDLEFLAKQGEPDAQYELFRFFDKEDRHDEKIDWLKKASKNGSDKAQHQLGLSYQYGWHLKKNLNLAVSWFLLAAKQQYLDSMSQLGFIYAQQGDQKRSKQWYSKVVRHHIHAVDSGNVSSMYTLGLMYQNAVGLVKDNKLAFKYYLLATTQGHMASKISLEKLDYQCEHIISIAGDDYALAKNGDSEAQFRLSEMFRHGEAIRKNAEQEFRWCLLAANNGYYKAEYRVAEMFRKGMGTQINNQLAVRYHQLLAIQGYKQSQKRLSALYKVGFGVQQDYSQMAKWFKQAQSGEAESQYIIGGIYYVGDVLTKDINKAYYWFNKSALQGYKKAQFYLAIILHEGTANIEQDVEKAIHWYRKASEQGHVESKARYRFLTTKNKAMDGDSSAQRELGGMLISGIGTTKDQTEAKKWLRLASRNYDDV